MNERGSAQVAAEDSNVERGGEFEGVLELLGALLVEERSALRTRNAAAVAGFAIEKENLVTRLQASAVAESESVRSPAVRERLGSIAAELRRNAILLASARDALRDALEAVRAVHVTSLSLRAPGALPSPQLSTARVRVIG